MGVYFCSPTACNNLVPLGSPPRLGVPTSAKSDNRPRLQQSANRSSASYPLFPGLTGGKGKRKKKGSPFPLTLFQLRRELRTHTSTPIHLFILPPHRHLDHHLQRREKNKNKKVTSNHHDYRPFPNHQHRHRPQPKTYCFIVPLYYWIIFKGCTTPLPNK